MPGSANARAVRGLRDLVRGECRLRDPAALAAARLGNLDPAVLGQTANGFREGEVLHLHHERESVTALLAAEAVVAAAVGVHVEGGSLLAVEGTQALVTSAGALERDATPDELHEIHAIADSLDDLVGDASHDDCLAGLSAAIRRIFLSARFRAAAAFFFLRTLGLS